MLIYKGRPIKALTRFVRVVTAAWRKTTVAPAAPVAESIRPTKGSMKGWIRFWMAVSSPSMAVEVAEILVSIS